jgi:ankyrin repeat protein
MGSKLSLYTKVVDEKIVSGDDINSQDVEDGWTLLHVAVKSGNVDAVTKLLQYGASMDIPDKEGTTPLSLSVQERQSECATYLSYGTLISTPVNE